MMIIDVKDQKRVSLLLFLLAHRNEKWVSLKMVTNVLKMSKQTALIHFDSLIEDLASLQLNDKIFIEITAENNIVFNIAPDFDKNILIAFYSERSVLFRLLMDILFNTFETIDHFAAENYVSISAIYKKIPYLKENLASLDILLDLKNKNRLVGSERQIRLFYYFLLFDISEYLRLPQFSYFPHSKNTEEKAENLLLFITAQRLSHKHFIADLDEIDKINSFPISYKNFWADNRDQIDGFFTPFHLEEETFQRELNSIYTLFACFSSAFSSYEETSARKIPEKISDCQTMIEKVSLAWVKEFWNFFQLKLSQKKKAYIYHLILARHVIDSLLKGNNAWFYQIITTPVLVYNNSNFYRKIQNFISYLKQTKIFSIYFSDGIDNSLELTYFGIANFFFLQLVAPVKILVYSMHGELNAFYITDLIRRNAQLPLTIKNKEEKNIDIVISDTPAHFSDTAKNILIQSLPSNADLDLIQKEIDNFFFAEQK